MLIKKLGSDAFPFSFQLPKNAPPSVAIQSGADEPGGPLGLGYEVRFYAAETDDDPPQRNSSVTVAVRKIQYCRPSPNVKQPSSTVSKVKIKFLITLITPIPIQTTLSNFRDFL